MGDLKTIKIMLILLAIKLILTRTARNLRFQNKEAPLQALPFNVKGHKTAVFQNVGKSLAVHERLAQ